ncbi:MAG: hypothetical protein KGZ43_07755 [Sulfuritalea sp.]|nr:hypothetical protein [Sulfuritalea sp.]
MTVKKMESKLAASVRRAKTQPVQKSAPARRPPAQAAAEKPAASVQERAAAVRDKLFPPRVWPD